MSLATAYLDLGNDTLKGMTGNVVNDVWFSAPNVLCNISELQYQIEVNSDFGNPEVAHVVYTPLDGSKRGAFSGYFAFGNYAIANGGVQVLGVRRYANQYIGVLASWVLSNLYKQSHPRMRIATLNAPSVRMFGSEIESAYKGKWTITHNKVTKTFVIDSVLRKEEIMGGVYNQIINDACTEFVEKSITAITVDIGGGTTEIGIVRNGKPDARTFQSVKVNEQDFGIHNIMIAFTGAIRENRQIKDALKHGWQLNTASTRKALQDKQILVESREIVIPLQAEYNYATSQYLASLARIYLANGGENCNVVWLTGGGGALLENQLMTTLNRKEHAISFINNSLRDKPVYTNVFGLRKYARLVQRAQAIEQDSE